VGLEVGGEVGREVGLVNGSQSSPEGQSPVQEKDAAPEVSILVPSQLVSPSHSMVHAPDPHMIFVFPLQASSPLQMILTLVASLPSISALPLHAPVPPLQVISRVVAPLPSMEVSSHAFSPSHIISQGSSSRHSNSESLH